ncbi:hypothetical protein HHK36_023467 [Tetracentron sinense]|uniref:B box-type domain-containing protein n=1 Tax=Tetracentron sinense TaxID=13715 RepID=A0A834YQB7_TETSI|nr:hypothetical protein HHK36_023467 [Tetracentron sinense]
MVEEERLFWFSIRIDLVLREREREREKMKIQCNACEAAEANVLCCADEAALCWACDEKVHAANKLASKHQRVPLSNSSSQMPKCDICQESVGYFFCLEDRALLCRKCDVAIHTANSHVSGHQRFLLTGVKVGLESTDPGGSSTTAKLNSTEQIAETASGLVSKRGNSLSLIGGPNEVLSSQVGGVGGPAVTKVSFAGGTTTGNIPEWHVDEFLGLTDFNQNYGYMDNGSSKVCPNISSDCGKPGDSEWSPFLWPAEEELDVDECLGQVPESSWTVPQVPSPPTGSGLYWPKNLRNPPSDSVLFVPDVCYTPMQNLHRHHLDTSISKRRRRQ